MLQSFIEGSVKMEISKTIVRLAVQYQTRQQLRHLPAYLFEDIGKTPQEIADELNKDRLQNYLRFCFQKSLSFKAFWKQFSVSYFVTIPKHKKGAVI